MRTTPMPGGVATAAGCDLATHLGTERSRVEEALAALRPGAPAGTPLGAALSYALETRGKRIRPILSCAAYRVAAEVPEPPAAVYRLSCAIELVHTYSLVHDDLPCMDDDDVRRGRPTLHRVHGTPLAVLAGSALIPLAVSLLNREAGRLALSGSRRGRLIVELCRAAGAKGMVGGQLLDLEAEHRRIDGSALEVIHRAKTGALLTASLRMGALAGGAEPGVLHALSMYGEALGLAFQIADDILDEVGTSGDLGKTAGKDRATGKATYPALHGLEGARKLARDRLAEAEAALTDGGVRSPVLLALARYAVERQA